MSRFYILPFFFLMALNFSTNICHAQFIHLFTQEDINILNNYADLCIFLQDEANLIKKEIPIDDNQESKLLNGNIEYKVGELYHRMGDKQYQILREEYVGDARIRQTLYDQTIRLYDIACQAYCESYLQYKLHVYDSAEFGIRIYIESLSEKENK